LIQGTTNFNNFPWASQVPLSDLRCRSCPKPLPGFPGWSPGGPASSKCGPACHGDPWRKFAGGNMHQLCKSGSHIEHIWLAVLTILKNMKVNGKDYPKYYGNQKMFETTSQIYNI